VQFKGIINAKQGPNTVKRKEKKSASIFSNPWKGDDIESDRLSICKKKEEEHIDTCFLLLLLLLLSIFLFQESRLMCLSSVKIPVDELVLITGE